MSDLQPWENCQIPESNGETEFQGAKNVGAPGQKHSPTVPANFEDLFTHLTSLVIVSATSYSHLLPLYTEWSSKYSLLVQKNTNYQTVYFHYVTPLLTSFYHAAQLNQPYLIHIVCHHPPLVFSYFYLDFSFLSLPSLSPLPSTYPFLLTYFSHPLLSTSSVSRLFTPALSPPLSLRVHWDLSHYTRFSLFLFGN